MDYCVNIEKQVDPDSCGNLPESCGVLSEIVIQDTAQCLDKKINDVAPPVPEPPPEPCIFKVHEGLRSVNEKAYTPILVSIGPYHHGNPNLSAMEEHKLRYLRSFLQRPNNNNTSVEPYLRSMEKLANRAKACYADPICLETNKFVEMLLVDACFIIEFLRRFCDEDFQEKDDPIFSSSWMSMQIERDLMLLENQIPFFVLFELLDVAFKEDSKKIPLMRKAINPISCMLPDRDSTWETIKQLVEKEPASESKHFLDLAHNIYLPLFGKVDSDSNRERKYFLDLAHNICLPLCGKVDSDSNSESKHFVGLPHDNYLPLLGKNFDSNRTTSKSTSTSHQICSQMSSVTELQEAGISFKVDDSDDVSILDISFDNGHMRIPKLKVDDGTETFLRNIIAYEQHSSSIKPKYFTDYMDFMDLLINTEKDVNALRLHGIIDNWLGDDGKVACMINKLGVGVIIDSSAFYYSDVCLKVKKHCEKPLNQAMAKLRRNYFSNPWAGISTVAAAVLLSLTLIQTALALIDRLA